MNLLTIKKLKEDGAILALQDGNHGEKHPVAADYVEQGIPFVMASDLADGSIDFLNCKKISHKQANSLRIGFSKTGDVLLSHKGTVGSVAIVPEVKSYVMLTPQVTYYRLDESKLHNKYLAYAFRSPDFQAQIKSLADQSTRPYVGITNQRFLKIPIPVLPIQKKIAGILSAYDDLIENNLKRIKLLEEMAQITYEEWFVRLRFPGHETVFINPETDLPEEWEERALNDLCSKITDGTHDSPKQAEEGCKLITGKHILNGFIDFETAYLISEADHLNIKKRSGLDKGDILFSNIGTLGNMAVVTQNFEFSCKNVIIFKNKVGRHNFLYTYLSNQNTRYKLFGQSAGVAQKFFSLKFIRTYKDFFPPNHLVEKFDNCVSGMYELKHQLHEQNQRLREARDILLPRLMTGMIDVEQYDPADLLKAVA